MYWPCVQETLRRGGLALMFLVLFGGWATAADHLDSPRLVASSGTLDINDLYAFQSPSNPSNFVMVMTVNPLAGVRSGTVFDKSGVYEFNIDFNGDAVPDSVYRIYFSAPRRGQQRFIVVGRGNRPVAFGRTGRTTRIRGGGQVTAGVFDDPFFFDLNGFNSGFNFTGDDFFAGANVNAIVLELPRSVFPVSDIAVTARTIFRGRQFDRMGRPAINTVLIPSPRKDLFNSSLVARDIANFSGDVQASIRGLGRTAEDAAALASVLLPDQLTVDTSSVAGFLNGRQLADDVIDAELQLLTGNSEASDMVDANDVAFRTTFPYLGIAH